MKKQMVFKAPKHAWVFYLLSFTWGLPMTLIGGLVALVLLIGGNKPTRFGWVWHFDFEIDWGVSLGLVMLCPKGYSSALWSLRCHEHGHALQNIYLGPLFPLLVGIPSVIRFWVRELNTLRNHPPKTDYDDIWFEGSATASGAAFMTRNNFAITQRISDTANALRELGKNIFKE